MKLLPIVLDVRGRNCLVVGGGAVAARKIKSLLDCGAQVTIIAPDVCDEIEALRENCTILRRTFLPDDCRDCVLVFACTNRREVNDEILRTARKSGALCNVVDNDDGDFALMATLRRGEITVGVSTQGGSPALARHLKAHIAETIGDEYAALLEIMSTRRANLKTDVQSQSARADLWRQVLDSNALSLLRKDKRDDAEELIDGILKRTP